MKLRSFLMSTVVTVVACGTAVAADLPSRAAPPVFVPPPVFVWTGFYLGAYAGAHFGGTDTFASVVDLKKTGIVGGGLAGFNWQFNQIVLGGEGEVGYADYSKTVVTPGGGIISNKANIDGRIRGRIGYAIGSFGFGNAMIFAAGGASFLENKVTGAPPLSSTTVDRIGFNVGAGLEVAVTPNWIVRGEYIYDDYGTKSYVFPGAGIRGGAGVAPIKITDNTVRAAIEYKFDWAAPAAVVARY